MGRIKEDIVKRMARRTPSTTISQVGLPWTRLIVPSSTYGKPRHALVSSTRYTIDERGLLGRLYWAA